MVLHHRAMRRQMGRGSQILIRGPIAAYVLAQEGPGLVFVRRTGSDPGACQELGRKEHETRRHSPSEVGSPNSPVPTQGLKIMGIRSG